MKKGFVFITLFFSFSCGAQFQTWVGAEFNFKPSKKTSFSLGLQQRQNNLTSWNRTLLNTGFSFKPITGINSFTEYRCSAQSNPHPELNFKNLYYKHRWSLGIDFSIIDWIDKSARFKLDWTIQQQWTIGVFQRENSITRNKILILYDINNFILSPFISVEHFYNWKRDIVYTVDDILITGGTSNNRCFAGFEIEISKKQALQVGMGIQKNYLSGKKIYIANLKYKVDIN